MRRIIFAYLSIVLVVAACGSSDKPAAAPTLNAAQVQATQIVATATQESIEPTTIPTLTTQQIQATAIVAQATQTALDTSDVWTQIDSSVLNDGCVPLLPKDLLTEYDDIGQFEVGWQRLEPLLENGVCEGITQDELVAFMTWVNEHLEAD